jgi:TRAP-type C4-dicarboxylate transport system substrate-binding protein
MTFSKWLKAAALGTLISFALNAAAQQKPQVLKIQTAVPTSSMYFELLKNFGERVNRMSAGRLKMEIL